MAVSVLTSNTAAVGSGYNATFTMPADLTGCDAALVYQYSQTGDLTGAPVVTVGGATATLIGQRSLSNGGTLWAWLATGFTPGAAVTVNSLYANTYIHITTMTVIGLSGVDASDPIGAVDVEGALAVAGGGTAINLTSSLVTEAADSMIFTTIGTYYVPAGPTQVSASPASTLVVNNTKVTDIPLVTHRQSASAAAQTISSSWSCPFNAMSIISVEVRGVSTPSTLTVEPAGIASTVAFGSPTLQNTGPQTIDMGSLASSAAFGSFAITGLSDVLTPADQGTKFLLTRTGTATYANADETLSVAATGVARAENRKGVDYGIIVEPAATNLIADNTGSGAVVGGAFPNGGGFYNGGVTGITCTVAGKGVEDGIEYVDLRFQGTNNTSSEVYPSYNMGAMTNAPVVNGDTLTLSAYARISAGNHRRASDDYPMVSLGMNVHGSTQNYVASLPNVQPLLDRDSLGHAREWTTATVASASAAYVNPVLALAIPAGRAFDFTVRLGLPQLEKSAYPTSVIKTAGTAAVSRGAEQLTALLPNGSQTIYVERVGITGLRQVTTYAAQTVSGGQWTVPAVSQFPYVRQISNSPINARKKAVESASDKGWLFGSAFTLADYNTDTAYATLLKAEASIYGAEYELKADQLQPTTEGTFTWTVADNFVARAATDGKVMRGHALIWNVSTPTWMNTAFTGASEARWKELVDDHIAAVIGRYPNMKSWDVVNEVLEPLQGNAGGLRTWSLYTTAGSAYIAYAFQRARVYAPDAELYICEYGMEENDTMAQNRRSSMLTLLTNLVNAGVPIDGLNIQCHLDLERPFSRSAFLNFLNAVKALGLKIIVTELDVRAPDGDTTLQYDLRAAARVREVIDCVLSVTTGNEIMCWNLRDQYTWLDELGNGRTQRPLPFEGTANTPKAMYAALQEAFEVAPLAAVSGDQEITVDSISSTVAFGSFTLSSPISVSPASIASTVAFGVPAVNLNVSPASVAPTTAFGTFTARLNVSPASIAPTVAFGAPAVGLNVSPASIASTVAFGVPAVRLNVSPASVAPTTAFGTFAAMLKVSPDSINPTTAFGVPAVNLNVSPASIAPTAAFGAFAAMLKVSPASIAPTTAFGLPALVSRVDMASLINSQGFGAFSLGASIAMQSLVNTQGFGAFGIVNTVTPESLVNTQGFGGFAVNKTVVIDSIGSSASFGTPAAFLNVNVDGLASTVAFGDLSMRGNVAMDGIASTAAFGDVAAFLKVNPESIAPTAAFGLPALVGRIDMASLVNSQAFGTYSLGANIAMDGLPSAVAFGDIGVEYTVKPDSLVNSQGFGAIGVVYTVTPASLVATQAFDAFQVVSSVAIDGIAPTAEFGGFSVYQRIDVAGVAPTAAFGQFSLGGNVALDGIAPDTRFGDLAAFLKVNVASIAPTTAFGTPSIQSTVAMAGIASTVAFGQPAVIMTVTPDSIAPTVNFGSVTIGVEAAIEMSSLVNSQGFGTFAIGGTVSVDGIASTVAFGGFSVVNKVTVSGIEPTAQFGDFAVHQTISPAGRPSSVSFGTFKLALNVAMDPVVNEQGFGAYAVGQQIRVDGIASSVAFGDFALHRSVEMGGLAPTTAFGTFTVVKSVVMDGIAGLTQFGPVRVLTSDQIVNQLRLFVGGEWKDCPVWVWDGSEWVQKPLKVFDGTNWKTIVL